MTRFSGAAATLVAAAMLAACGGGTNDAFGGTGITSSTQVSSASAAISPDTLRAVVKSGPLAKRTQGKVKITIQIPLGKTGRQQVKSMTVAVLGAAMQTFNLRPKSPGCSKNGSTVSCLEETFFPKGQTMVTIALYSKKNGAGKELSVAHVPAKIAPVKAVDIPITLGTATAANAQVFLDGSTTDSILEGVTTSVSVSVTAYDAAGDVIMAPRGYSSPVTLSNSDTSGSTSLSAMTVRKPNTPITLHYNGGNVSSATITPSVNGTPQTAGAATLNVTAPTIVEYSIPLASGAPSDIAAGPDGALWFAENYTGQVGRITTEGTITGYPVSGGSFLRMHAITAGPDDAMWFGGFYYIGRIATGGAVTEYSASTTSQIYGITAGPDGALWFTDGNNYEVGRAATDGTITEYSIPTDDADSWPLGITAGPDGALWFTEYNGNQIGRITTSGRIAEYSIPTDGSEPGGVTTGPDGALWFTECAGNKIGRITTDGAISEYPIPTSNSYPSRIVTGPDHALWFTENRGNKIGRITTGGAVAEYSIPSPFSEPQGITLGPNGTLWFTECGGNKIGEIK